MIGIGATQMPSFNRIINLCCNDIEISIVMTMAHRQFGLMTLSRLYLGIVMHLGKGAWGSKSGLTFGTLAHLDDVTIGHAVIMSSVGRPYQLYK